MHPITFYAINEKIFLRLLLWIEPIKKLIGAYYYFSFTQGADQQYVNRINLQLTKCKLWNLSHCWSVIGWRGIHLIVSFSYTDDYWSQWFNWHPYTLSYLGHFHFLIAQYYIEYLSDNPTYPAGLISSNHIVWRSIYPIMFIEPCFSYFPSSPLKIKFKNNEIHWTSLFKKKKKTKIGLDECNNESVIESYR